MERRKFVIGAGALATGSAAAMGTGAFSQAQAERDVTVQTVGDEDAYLGLNATSEYAENSGGDLIVDFGSNNRADGANQDGSFLFNDVFNVTNQGEEDDIVIAARVTGDLASGDTQILNVFNSDTWDADGTGDSISLNVEDNFQNLDNDFAPRPDGSTLPDYYPSVDAGESVSIGLDFVVGDTADVSGNIDIIAVKDPEA